jgi:hypothetical protein
LIWKALSICWALGPLIYVEPGVARNGGYGVGFTANVSHRFLPSLLHSLLESGIRFQSLYEIHEAGTSHVLSSLMLAVNLLLPHRAAIRSTVFALTREINAAQ